MKVKTYVKSDRLVGATTELYKETLLVLSEPNKRVLWVSANPSSREDVKNRFKPVVQKVEGNTLYFFNGSKLYLKAYTEETIGFPSRPDLLVLDDYEYMREPRKIIVATQSENIVRAIGIQHLVNDEAFVGLVRK